jgi:ABC-2 type transport system permease protein
MKLLLAELKRSWTMLRRYGAETIGGIVATTVVFYGLFLSAKYVAGEVQFGDRLDAIVVGYVLGRWCCSSWATFPVGYSRKLKPGR